jgi:predicted nucleic acid-binding protein
LLTAAAYIDTSALAKRYLPECGSDELDRFLENVERASISRLVVVELSCVLARRRRNREIDARTERRVMAAFEQDVTAGFFEVHPLEDRHAVKARELLGRLAGHPLRTLDAIHLAIATVIGVDTIATADGVFASAAAALSMRVERFGSARSLSSRR